MTYTPIFQHPFDQRFTVKMHQCVEQHACSIHDANDPFNLLRR
jgi:hypothetical protein